MHFKEKVGSLSNDMSYFLVQKRKEKVGSNLKLIN
jgi:hypothetical protein